jgi:hypothetical protein
MKKGRILGNYNGEFLEEESEKFEESDYETSEDCFYDDKFAFVERYYPGSYQSHGVTRYYKYTRIGFELKKPIEITKPEYQKKEAAFAASVLGSLGGSVKSKAKSEAARENGKMGGRPRKSEK